MASAEETKSLDPRSGTCGVCLEKITDPRLLDCLHSFCRRCVDQLVLASSTDGSSGGRTVRCPLCRSVCPIPKEGADGLVKDVTRPTEMGEPKCHACEEEGGHEQPALWCSTCRVRFCKEHSFAHVLKLSGHSLTAIPECTSNYLEDTPAPMLVCAIHKQPLDFHCVSCGENVCGHCISIGQHAGHTPIMLHKDMVAKREAAVSTKVDELQDLLPQMETALTSVDKVSTDLASRANQVRDEIRAAGQRVIDAVSMGVAKKLQQVEEIEQTRSKVLDKQHDDLKELVEGVKSVISFTDSLKAKKVLTERMDDLLPAVEKRVASLRERELIQEPKEHSTLFFKGGEIEDAAAAAALDQFIGKVSNFRATAMEICEETPTGGKGYVDDHDILFTGETAAITMQAKGRDGKPLSVGGDIITTQWISGSGNMPLVTVTDHDDGRYLISFTPQDKGEYILMVIVNGIRVTETISRRCMARSAVTFDPRKCQEPITLSDRCHRATLAVDKDFQTVLGRPGMKTGQHQWTVRVSANATTGNARLVGVVPRSEAAQALSNDYSAYAWNGFCGQVWKKGKRVHAGDEGESWKSNDVVQVNLDCGQHFLNMTNLRSGKSIAFADLPDEELFPYFQLSQKDATMTLVE